MPKPLFFRQRRKRGAWCKIKKLFFFNCESCKATLVESKNKNIMLEINMRMIKTHFLQQINTIESRAASTFENKNPTSLAEHKHKRSGIRLTNNRQHPRFVSTTQSKE